MAVLIATTGWWRRRSCHRDLYLTNGRYGRWNRAGLIATMAGCALAWGGLAFAPLRPLFDYAWFVGFGVAAVVYLLLNLSAASRA